MFILFDFLFACSFVDSHFWQSNLLKLLLLMLLLLLLMLRLLLIVMLRLLLIMLAQLLWIGLVIWTVGIVILMEI